MYQFVWAYEIINGGIFMNTTGKRISAALLACLALTTFGGGGRKPHLMSI